MSNFYANKLAKDKMDNFLEKYHFSVLIQEEKEPTWSQTIKEIKSVIKDLPIGKIFFQEHSIKLKNIYIFQNI